MESVIHKKAFSNGIAKRTKSMQDCRTTRNNSASSKKIKAEYAQNCRKRTGHVPGIKMSHSLNLYRAYSKCFIRWLEVKSL